MLIIHLLNMQQASDLRNTLAVLLNSIPNNFLTVIKQWIITGVRNIVCYVEGELLPVADLFYFFHRAPGHCAR